MNWDKTSTILGVIGGGITIIAAIFGAWWKIESTIQTTVKMGTEVVTKDVQQSTVALVTELLNDVKLRLHGIQLEIKSYQEQGKPVPERLTMSEMLLQERIKDIEKKWFQEQ